MTPGAERRAPDAGGGRAPAEGETLEAFLARLASPTPAAGGGAAAAVSGALAAALVSMVCGITARHLESAPALAEIGADADRLRRRLATLVDADVEAYQRVLDARRLSPEARGPSLRDALGRATEVPLEVARAGATLLAHGAALVEQARASTVSDLGVAAALAWAALEAGALTARANLATLDDAAAGVATGRELDALTAQGTALRGRVAEAVARRAVGGGPRPR